ncbi:MAG: Gfo/Idh/MocA family protein [bacterium]
MKEYGIGMVGYGFIGKVHTYAYKNLDLFYDPPPCRVKLVGVCTAHEDTAGKAIEQAGYEFATTDYRKLLARDDIHIVNCCTPNYLHKKILVDSLRAGKHIYCDKPLAMNLREAREIVEEAKAAGVVHQMTFEYRFIPAILRAKQLVDEGFLGDVFSFRSAYLHSGYIDPDRPMSWRLDKGMSGGGALFDLGSHVLDLIRFLLGDVAEVYATTKTFITERPVREGSPERAKVEVDDLVLMQIRMRNGALGTLEASRVATGTNDELRLEIHGSRGAIYFNHQDPNWLYVYDTRDKEGEYGGDRGFKRIEAVQRYPSPAALPGPKFAIGWMRFHLASQYDFLCNVVRGKVGHPNLEDGCAVQEIMEAATLSADWGRWVSLPL